jgi:hypothetical protein
VPNVVQLMFARVRLQEHEHRRTDHEGRVCHSVATGVRIAGSRTEATLATMISTRPQPVFGSLPRAGSERGGAYRGFRSRGRLEK